MTPPIAQLLHNEADVVDGDVVEDLQHGLLAEPKLEVESTDPLVFRLRVPLSWVNNPSGVLALYQDQLDAQTHDQVIVCVCLYIYIIFSHIHNNDNFSHIDIEVAWIFVGVIGVIHRRVNCPST